MTTETRTGLPLTLHGDRATVRRIGAASPSRRLESPRRHREPPDKSRDTVAPYASHLEVRFAKHLEQAKSAHSIQAWWYQPCTLRLADGTRYRPDFLVVPFERGRGPLAFYEIKGYHPNRRDSLTHLKWAASMHTWADFWLIQWKNGRWHETRIG